MATVLAARRDVRVVGLVGTAHGNALENLLVNPTLSDLVGGIQPVTLGDEEARRRGTPKTLKNSFQKVWASALSDFSLSHSREKASARPLISFSDNGICD